MELGSFVRLWDTNGAAFMLSVEEEPRIDAAVSKWIDSGKTQDTLLDLIDVVGAPYKTLASEITSWLILTPESRRAGIAYSKALDDEAQVIRTELGIFEE